MKIKTKQSRKKQNEKIFYDKQSEVLWFLIKSGSEEEHKEISPGISLELGKKGELLGIEILNASQIMKPLLENKSQTKIS